MIPEIGQFALILALMLALTLAVLPQIGASRGISQLVAMARPTAQAQFIFVAIAFSCLAYSFINNDFSVLNVATNSNSQLPLQYRAMVAHPPMLYMGYVGFSVAFAFAISALIGGKLDATWARWSRPWTTVAWMFLTCGIALGSFWAYYELGWGGWWFWDPVENASFMPWLVGTALIHSLAVTEKR